MITRLRRWVCALGCGFSRDTHCSVCTLCPQLGHSSWCPEQYEEES